MKSIWLSENCTGGLSKHALIMFLGVDCDEVFPGIVLGNGATVKKKDYLKKIGEFDDT